MALPNPPDLTNVGLGTEFILSKLIPYINALPAIGTPSILSFGATGNGTTNENAAFLAAVANNQPTYDPLGTYQTTLTPNQLPFRLYGEGLVKTSTNTRGRYFSRLDQAPANLGNSNSVETAFNGDWTHSPFPVEHRILGAATLGLPTTGYLYTPEAYPYYTYLYSESGHNQSASSNVGRTAGVANQTQIYQHGQGDLMAYSALAFGDTTNPSATSILACPAIVLFAGQATAGISHMYLNPVEIDLDDKGFDVAGAGFVTNLKRSVTTAALGEFWYGFRGQSTGTATIDAMFSGTGNAKFGLDLANMTLDANLAAITLKRDQRIYGNATPGTLFPGAVGNDYIVNSSSISGWLFVVGAQPSLQVTSSQVTAFENLKCAAGIGFYGTTPVVQQTVTGAKGGNAAVASLLTALATSGLIIDSTSA